jgi:hypothetical protein
MDQSALSWSIRKMGRADGHDAQKYEEPGDKGRPAADAEQRKKSSGGNHEGIGLAEIWATAKLVQGTDSISRPSGTRPRRKAVA